MTVRLAKIMFRENDQESDMEYAGRMTRKVTRNMTSGANKDVLSPEDSEVELEDDLDKDDSDGERSLKMPTLSWRMDNEWECGLPMGGI